MIRSEPEYKEARRRLEQDREVAEKQRAALVAAGLAPEDVERAMQPLLSFQAPLEDEIAWWPFRRGERWAWVVSWVYPLFWLAHLAAGLPPGNDHVHQVVLGVAALVALALAARRTESG